MGCLFGFVMVVQVSAVAAQGVVSEGPAAVFSKLEGEWVGSGVLLDRPAEFRMAWSVGPGSFVRLTFSNAWVNEDSTRTAVLSSEATYLPRGSEALGVWLDDRPQRLTIHAALTDSSIIANWTAETEAGRTEYVVRSREGVVVRDIVHVDGSERLFGYATYRRVSPGPQKRP